MCRPSRPRAPQGAGSTVSRSEGGPASLRRETPRVQRETFQTEGAGWDLRILRWGGARQGTGKGLGPGFL